VLISPAAYFERVHPEYPFLDWTDFEEKAGSSHFQGIPAFSALYHTVLALGCQYRNGGSFDPGNGVASSLYQTALGLFSDILVPKERLLNVQVSLL
jgi:hypothetical protein